MEMMKTLSRKLIYDQSPFLKLESHTVQLANGDVIENWSWLVTPDFVNVVAITEAQEYLCFRQVKYGVQGSSLAPIGGYIEPGEDPLVAAKRELLEEMGYKARHWEKLGQFVVDANRGNGTAHFFLARDAYQVAEPNSDDLEEQILLKLSRAEVEAAVARGAFKVLAWHAIMTMALLR
jgi:ADP-ribose pyrophosphatase